MEQGGRHEDDNLSADRSCGVGRRRRSGGRGSGCQEVLRATRSEQTLTPYRARGWPSAWPRGEHLAAAECIAA